MMWLDLFLVADMHALILLPTWSLTAAIGHDRTEDQPNTFPGSPEFSRLNQALGGGLTQRACAPSCVPYHTSYVSIGFDFGQVFRHKDRSTGVMCIR